MATLQEYRGKFALGTTANSFSISTGTPQACELTTGRYYIAGYTSEATAQLVEHIQAVMRTKSGFSAATCTYDPATGKVSLGFAATTSVTWTDVALRNLLGFTADLSGASSYTATNQARYVWRPSLGPAEYPLQLNRFWSPESTSTGKQTRGGTAYGSPGATRYQSRVRYEKLPAALVRVPSTGSINQEFEQFWSDVLTVPMPVRIFPDRTIYTASGYVTAQLASAADEGYGVLTDIVRRSIAVVDTLWDVDLIFHRVTE